MCMNEKLKIHAKGPPGPLTLAVALHQNCNIREKMADIFSPLHQEDPVKEGAPLSSLAPHKKLCKVFGLSHAQFVGFQVELDQWTTRIWPLNIRKRIHSFYESVRVSQGRALEFSLRLYRRIQSQPKNQQNFYFREPSNA